MHPYENVGNRRPFPGMEEGDDCQESKEGDPLWVGLNVCWCINNARFTFANLSKICKCTVFGRQKYQWISHTLVKGDNCITSYAIQWNSLFQDVRRVSHSKGTWRRIVEDECKHLRKSQGLLQHVSGNRERWCVDGLDTLYPTKGWRAVIYTHTGEKNLVIKILQLNLVSSSHCNNFFRGHQRINPTLNSKRARYYHGQRWKSHYFPRERVRLDYWPNAFIL